ncbi:MAG: PEP/pyruvate-binding domain-containing protein [Burkholderiales bacterium]
MNVVGIDGVLEAVRRCWASLWTDRAVTYRARNSVGQRAVQLAVVVQRIVPAEISGILFTADPVTGSRTLCSIDASYGLGEALVSGRVNADVYRLRKATGELVEARVGDKAMAVWPLPGGGTEERPVPEDRRRARVLDDGLLARLVALAQRVEAHYGQPQDIEWCLAQGQLYLVQTRPITSLFPLPEPRPRDEALHVYFSVGHAQVNTAALHPMSLSLFHEIFARSDYVTDAAGRIYLDLTPVLHNRMLKSVLPQVLDEFAPGTQAELRAVTDRPEFAATRGGVNIQPASLLPFLLIVGKAIGQLFRRDLGGVRAEYEAALVAKVAQWNSLFANAEPGLPQLRVASEQLRRMAAGLLPMFLPILYCGLLPLELIRALTRGRVEPRTVDALTRGLSGNVTTEMILQLGDLADLAREAPALAQHLQTAKPEMAIESARELPGSELFFAAWDKFIERYGHRCPTENDFALPRWREGPSSLVTMLVGMLGTRTGELGAHRRQFAAAIQEAESAAEAILKVTPRWQRPLMRALIRRVRAYLALREHHRFAFSQLFMNVRQAILEAARMAMRRGRLRGVDDVWFLELDELIGLLSETASSHAMGERIGQRKEDRARFERLTPPRLLTSDGEILRAATEETLPPNTFAGVAVSAGVVEGIARVVLDPAHDVLRPGEILVAPFTDPGWTPLFVHAGALVMEVGGMMTHGSVIAREYGLPAVVSVEGATQKIRTGQRLRVDGDHGYVTLLDQEVRA